MPELDFYFDGELFLEQTDELILWEQLGIVKIGTIINFRNNTERYLNEESFILFSNNLKLREILLLVDFIFYFYFNVSPRNLPFTQYVEILEAYSQSFWGELE